MSRWLFNWRLAGGLTRILAANIINSIKRAGTRGCPHEFLKVIAIRHRLFEIVARQITRSFSLGNSVVVCRAVISNSLFFLFSKEGAL